MNKIQTVNAEQFRDCVFFSLTIRKPGNRAKVRDMSALAEYLRQLNAPDADGAAKVAPAVDLPRNITVDKLGSVKVTKRLLLPDKEKDSDPFEAACAFLSERKDRLTGRFGRALPSKIKEGLFVVRKDLVQSFEDDLRADLATLAGTHIPAVQGDYAAAKSRAEKTPVKQGGLGPLYREADYPTVEDFCGLFGLEWQWLALGVPEDLPAALRAEAAEKLEKQFTEAAEEVKNALRVGFQELIAHATEKLTSAPGEKPKIFRDTLIGNIAQFCEVFDSRNLMNDTELEALVTKAKAVLQGDNGETMDAERLRKFANVRENTAKQFAEIGAALEGMITIQTSRKFELTDD